MVSMRLKRGELEDFFRREQKSLFKYINYLVRDTDTAADVLQVACLRFIKQVEKGNILRETAVNYLYRIARNEVYAGFKAKKGKAINVESIDNYLEQSSITDGKAASEKQFELRSLFLATLQNGDLDKNIREVLYMRFLKVYSVEQIARKMKKSRSYVYRMSEEGIRYLASKFRNAGYKLEDFE